MKETYKIFFILLLTSAIALVGCSKDDDDTDNSSVSGTSAPVPTKGSATRPTDWSDWQNSLSSAVYTVSNLSVVCDATGIEFHADSLDMVGAFINGQCRGYSDAYMQTDSTALFMFTVSITQDEYKADTVPSVTFKYYSNKGTKIYTTQPVYFQEDGRWGSIKNPYHFTWSQSGN